MKQANFDIHYLFSIYSSSGSKCCMHADTGLISSDTGINSTEEQRLTWPMFIWSNP